MKNEISSVKNQNKENKRKTTMARDVQISLSTKSGRNKRVFFCFSQLNINNGN